MSLIRGSAPWPRARVVVDGRSIPLPRPLKSVVRSERLDWLTGWSVEFLVTLAGEWHWSKIAAVEAAMNRSCRFYIATAEALYRGNGIVRYVTGEIAMWMRDRAGMIVRKLSASLPISVALLRDDEDRVDYDRQVCETRLEAPVAGRYPRIPCFIHTRWSPRCDPATRFATLFGDRLREAVGAFRSES